ncbi:hypothetical protein [Streptomonospora litoralis]|uniref:Uncharacterized protein n=1 Tax=Streptomonospora litoralis TaxID=2498135 RepID=A0A4P6Q400_9ACTN|nr:hypothetical protein [Streptomonospora litoralis]QBI55355.1 hypothetical protein EKD16_17955 [Streptomonospora litoralis]
MAGNTESPGMLTTALVLGIVGGVFGIIGAILWMLFAGFGAAFDMAGAGAFAGGGFIALFLAVLGIVG